MVTGTILTGRHPLAWFSIIALGVVAVFTIFLNIESTENLQGQPTAGLCLGSASSVRHSYPAPSTLWPRDAQGKPILRPAHSGLLPAERDSTDYITQTMPGAPSGHELFKSLDIVDNILFVQYTEGVSAWDISGQNAADPKRLDYRDLLIEGHFPLSEGYGEVDEFLTDIDAMKVGNKIVVAVSARSPRMTIFSFYPATKRFTDHYLDESSGGSNSKVKLTTINGKPYLFATGEIGVQVYDVETALTKNDCYDENPTHAEPIRNCGVYLGQFAERGNDISIIGDHLILQTTTSQGFTGLEIWKITGPTTGEQLYDETSTSANRNNKIWASEAFTIEGNTYLATVRSKENTPKETLTIYDISCILDGTCNTLNEVWHTVLANEMHTMYSLTFSMSGDTPFLYLSGIPELLLDLSDIHNPIELTANGPQLPYECEYDPVANMNQYWNVDGMSYWTWYYTNHIVNHYYQRGMFNNEYFYRAGYYVLDVHIRGETSGDSQPPPNSTDVPNPLIPGYAPPHNPINGDITLRTSGTGTSTPPGRTCGDGTRTQGEECDEGSANGACPATCSTTCALNNCPTQNCDECTLGQTACHAIVGGSPGIGQALRVCKTVDGCNIWQIESCPQNYCEEGQCTSP